MTENSPVPFEAKDYFQVIKTNNLTISSESLTLQTYQLVENLKKAKLLGQDKLFNRLKFYIDASKKQVKLIDTQFNTYVESNLISDYIEKVQPKNSVKIVELSRYVRVIPDKNMDDIIKAKELNIFDDILILYTDFTNQRNETKAEKAVIARNKDPIAFGVFRDKVQEISHPKFFVISDWVDEWCDLNFDKLIDEAVKYGIEDTKGKLTDKELNMRKILADYDGLITDV
ncbi:MAG: hypothetical protein RSC93_01790 [Erysipelotrichaceae bacterium]